MENSKPEKQFDLRWLLLGGLLIVSLLFAVLINYLQKNGQEDIKTSQMLAIDNGDLDINWAKYPTTNINLTESIEIKKPGVYRLSGALSDGLIEIDVPKTEPVKLVLDNVSIKNSSGPAIICHGANDLVVELIGENYLEDNANYADSFDANVVGAIYVNADTTFLGNGTLNITANNEDAIVSKDDLKFRSGNYKISAKDDAIRGNDSVYVVDGEFNIKAGTDALKSTNDYDPGKGFALIEGGKFSINAGGTGIEAINTILVKDGEITVSKSYEGLEAQAITIDGGEISLTTFDDGINAGSRAENTALKVDANCILTINDGNVYINAAGDGVDSNGYVYFNGGRVVIDGPTNNDNGALDAGIEIKMTGGEVTAVGSDGMAETLGANSSVYNIGVFLPSISPKGTLIEIKNSADETVLSHTSAKTFSYIAAGSNKFSFGETYSIYLNGKKFTDFMIQDMTTIVESR